MVTLLAQNRWPFRLHATYDESITRALNVYEEVNRDVPLKGLHWFIDHAETISRRNMDRIAAMGGGIAIQHRMAFQGEYFRDRYGETAVSRTPPIREMLQAGLPVGAGTDATRVASYNPFVSLYWLVTGRTVGGLAMYDENNRLDRMEALRLWTVGSSWFSTEQGSKGAIVEGNLRTWLCCRPTIFRCRTKRSNNSNPCSRSWAASRFTRRKSFSRWRRRFHRYCRNGLRWRHWAVTPNRRSPCPQFACGWRTLPHIIRTESCVSGRFGALLGVLERRCGCEHKILHSTSGGPFNRWKRLARRLRKSR